MLAISKNLKYFREKKGYTQEQLAILLNRARCEISLYENGRRNPTLATLVKTAEILGVSYEELINGKQEENKNEKS